MSQHLSVKQAKLLHKHRYILEKLAGSSIKDQRKIISKAPNDLFKVLNIIFKLLRDDKINLSQKDKKHIQKHKKFIRTASGHKKVASIRSQLRRQQGGSFKKVLSTVLPIIGAIVRAIV